MDRNQNQTSEQQGQGRTSNTGEQNPDQKTQRDISDIDRQEGEMDHGETGGAGKSGEAEEK